MNFSAILDSSIMQKGLPATAGSKMLVDFVSPINATVVTRLEAAGVQIVGRCDVGEFGVDGLFGCQRDSYPDNLCRKFYKDCQENRPSDNSEFPDFALCNDYTGAISLSAAKHGLYYIHPTYGSVSRYGLIPAVSSMDQIGVLCKDPEAGFEVLRMISGFDSKDGAMDEGAERLSGKWKVESGKLRADKETVHLPLSIKTDTMSPCFAKYSKILPQVMQILCCAEIGNNISRYDGIKFGYRARGYNGLRELYTKSRTEAFGENVKLAAVLGAMVLSQENYMRYYDKAMRLRRLIRDSLEFDECDVITSEGLGTRDNAECRMQNAELAEQEDSSYNLLMLSRLCGLPSFSTPKGVYVADVGREDLLEVESGKWKVES